MVTNDLKGVVREKYGEAARRVRTGGTSCCGTAPNVADCCDPITSNLYDAIRKIVEPLGGIELELPLRVAGREPPRFDQDDNVGARHKRARRVRSG